ncbi:DNA-binding protein [Streptomyces ipomoeae]|uniref:DNA-binding protein n=1 Tax=Streptomyces ipomoeae TaxID=103232 RepID=UPI0029A14624|nr:DNA-binding protein [Streptomyces ipomoeae]MDX2696029.1 DNA-binding protein [Streptomyces ipomoeae]MDX2841442.1 DNA-binding protein [Streptomyces ipomoeae]
MATKAYEQYGIPVPPEDPYQEYMTVQETAYVLRCSVSWLRRFLKKRPDLCTRNGNRGRIVTNREDRAAINEARRAGDPRTGRTLPRQRRRPTTRKPASAAA